MNTIFTVGYEGATIADFIATLKSAGVQTLADVREVSVSRKKGFSKTKLQSLLAEAGIEYVHFRQLGDPKAGRTAARRGDMEIFREIYGAHIALPASAAALQDLAVIARAGLTCLMCYERDPRDCHRRIIANKLDSYNLVSFDLFIDKRDRYEQFPERLPSHRFGQGTAAAQQQPL